MKSSASVKTENICCKSKILLEKYPWQFRDGFGPKKLDLGCVKKYFLDAWVGSAFAALENFPLKS